MPTAPSIHLIKGSMIHKVLEDFFDLKPEHIPDDHKSYLRLRTANLLRSNWLQSQNELQSLKLDNLPTHFDDSAIMVSNWLEFFFKRMKKMMKEGLSAHDAFSMLTPIREKQYRSEGYAVRGFIDAVEEIDEKVKLIDYKTSSRDHISEAYYLQLSIYALLYLEEHERLPDHVALHFLRHGERALQAEDAMVSHAIKTLDHVHKKTLSKDKKDYPIKASPLCKYSTGCCDFYEQCFNTKDAEKRFSHL